MSNKNYISKIVAGFLLFVFAFSIAPMVSPHFYCSNHGVDNKQTHHSEKASLNKAQFSCKLGNLITESPFTPAVNNIEFHSNQWYHIPQENISTNIFTAPQIFFSLRGPPIAIS